MAFPQAMMHEEVWFDRLKYEEATDHYQLFLTNNLSANLSKTHFDQQDGVTQVVSDTGSALVNEIAKARDNIKQSLAGMEELTVKLSLHAKLYPLIKSKRGGNDDLQKENKALTELVEKLAQQVAALEARVTKLEGGAVPEAKTEAKTENKQKKDDDDDFDLFDDDSEEEEEETEEQKKKREELLRKYHEKKSGKKQVIAKSSVLFDVKPWDDETDMAETERLVRTIEMDGLVWGAGKLVPLAYGIKKLSLLCVIEDDKVSTDELSEKICEFEDFVQSVDIAAFNKI